MNTLTARKNNPAMIARKCKLADISRLVDLLMAQGYEVFAPFVAQGRDTFFERVDDHNRADIQLHFANPYYPPKQYVLPQVDRILSTCQTPDKLDIQPIYDQRKRAIFGIRSCDVAGIDHLDRFFLGRDFVDTYYQQRRENLFLVNLVCTDKDQDIGDECFCVCTDTGPAAKDHFDLQLMDMHDGTMMAVAGSPAGEALLADPMFEKVDASDVAKRRALLAEVRKNFKRSTTSWFSAAVRYLSQGENLDQAFDEIGNRCLECGACSYVCPSCTCFTVTDRRVSETESERIRTWDSCALYGFTRMAGGHNPRKATHDRRNRRFFRKLAHYFIQRELSMACVGCGRCDIACHGDVGMPSTVEIIRRATDPRRPALSIPVNPAVTP